MAIINKTMKILVVDDFATMRRIVKNILTQLGFTNIVEAEDGKQALGKVMEGDIDMIISDWNMPNMMGIDFLKAVRGNPNTKSIPFLMVTAEANKENILAAVQAGVTNYVIKPFTAEVLEQKFKSMFGK